MSASEKININTADIDTLTTLPGIAEGLAGRIIEYRENVHPFEEVIELAAVPGISERMVRIFEDLVTVGDVGSMDTRGADEIFEVIEEREESTPQVDDSLIVTDTEALPTPEEAVAESTTLEGETVVREEEYEAPAIVTEEPVEETPAMEEVATAALLADDHNLSSEDKRTEEKIQESKEVVENNMEDKVEETSAPRPVFESTPPPSRPTVVTPPPQPASSGFSWLAVLLGAVLGAILALAAVFALGFARTAYVNQQITQLAASRADVDTLNTTVSTLTSSIDAVSGDLANNRQGMDDLNNELENTNTRLDEATGRIDELVTTQGELDTAVTTAQGDIVTLQESDTVMSGRIDEVAQTAETFDNFLMNLRDLLNALDAPAAEATPAADTPSEATPTPASEGDTPAANATVEPTMSILETAEADGRFTILLSLVEEAGLTESLAEEGPFTLFAPTDNVFEDLPPGALETLSQDQDLLLSILNYHVTDGSLLAEDLVDMANIPTFNGEAITITVTNDGVLLNTAQITVSNIGTTNGIIHVIDDLLIPPSLFGEEGGESSADTTAEEATPTPVAEEEGTPTPEGEDGEPTPIPVTPTPTP